MNAERLLAHYERIADAPDAVARLRRFVLDLAVRGKLAPQDPEDEPASVLRKRIAAEKARLGGRGRSENPASVTPQVWLRSHSRFPPHGAGCAWIQLAQLSEGARHHLLI